MTTPPPFALQAASACAPHAELALSLAGAFHDVDAGAASARLARLAAHLPARPSGGPRDELESLAALMQEGVFPRLAPGHDVAPLMLDRALAAGAADTLVRAVVAVECARRRGIPAGLVSNGVDHCVGHTRLDEEVLVQAVDGALVDARMIAPVLQWQCAHEACGLLLDELETRWLRYGWYGEAVRAAELRTCLPFDADGALRARMRLGRVRSRLN